MLNSRYFKGLWRIAFLGALCIVVTSAIPLHVSPDGYLYLQSAKYLFTADVATGYAWIREPLYPLILKITRATLGSSDRSLIFVQSAALVASAQLVSTAILPRRPRLQTLTIVLITLNPVSMMYAGSVLQTTWIGLSIAGFTWLVAKSWDRCYGHSYRLAIALMVWTALSAYLSFQLGYLGLGAGAAAGAGLAVRAVRRRPVLARQSTVARVSVVIGGAALGAVMLTFVGIAALLPWKAYKEQTVNSFVSAGGITTDQRGLLVEFNSSGPTGSVIAVIKEPVVLGQTVLKYGGRMLSISPGAVDENVIYSEATLAWPCGALEEALMIDAARTEALGLIKTTCRNPKWIQAINAYKFRAYSFIGYASWAFVLALITLPLLRRYGTWAALIPGLQLVVMYSMLGVSFTRYAFPIYQLGTAVLILGLGLLLDKARRGARTLSRGRS